jgi:hypothetical protein
MSFQEPNEAHAAPQPTLCVTGCGFFANPSSNGFCSKCFRERQTAEDKHKQVEDSVRTSIAQTTDEPAKLQQPASVVSHESGAAEAAPCAAPAAASCPESATKCSTRCQVCRKKVGLTGFKCRCSPCAVFCGQHRYAEEHNCAFDYKGMQREKLAAANPVVQASKIDRI